MKECGSCTHRSKTWYYESCCFSLSWVVSFFSGVWQEGFPMDRCRFHARIYTYTTAAWHVPAKVLVRQASAGRQNVPGCRCSGTRQQRYAIPITQKKRNNNIAQGMLQVTATCVHNRNVLPLSPFRNHAPDRHQTMPP